MENLQKKIKKLLELDKIKQEHSENLDNIYKRVSPAGGYNESIFNDVSEKIYNISKKQASIWNEIRGIIINNETLETLWDVAIKKCLDVSTNGKEVVMKFRINDLFGIMQLA